MPKKILFCLNLALGFLLFAFCMQNIWSIVFVKKIFSFSRLVEFYKITEQIPSNHRGRSKAGLQIMKALGGCTRYNTFTVWMVLGSGDHVIGRK